MGDTLFDMPAVVVSEPNPCVALYGPGPAGVNCGRCAHLLARQGRSGRRWYKCALRRSSQDLGRLGAASTDHRGKWNACGRFEERTE